ncbi:hypothetical protein CSPHI_06595 [Corynebacterium sphenisci DSM 44792]|uniref:Uncharacterized protein n=1 Tax=Corynebacterium sphenisci DSM 44792 TaxID=1437874 RepID=A0A1L7CY05_9CORY|nr:hypothetical protein [Corynebacterium sphenisci]APT90769.1 hypothetical protein CSPHI_06595 [Corynebacterium sphenisci DSM 44792]
MATRFPTDAVRGFTARPDSAGRLHRLTGYGADLRDPDQAALNMRTRPAAAGLREHGIPMTAVDTGWITDGRPHPTRVRPACGVLPEEHAPAPR